MYASITDKIHNDIDPQLILQGIRQEPAPSFMYVTPETGTILTTTTNEDLPEPASTLNDQQVPIDILIPGAKPIILETPVVSTTSPGIISPVSSSQQTITTPQTSYKRGIVVNSGLTGHTRNDFSRSATARKRKIDNTIPEEYHDRIDLMVDILNDLQNAWGSPIKLTSGFRSPELNKNLSGSSKTSVHMQGYAMDIVPVNGQMDKFIKFIKEWSKDKNYDQILFESNKKGSRWVHFGLYNNAGQQRQQMKYLHV